jgi:nucleoside-diphosphate-sugar epimerase
VNILIVGASGNLGFHLSKHLLGSPHRLRLLKHTRALPFDLPQGANAEIIQADLNEPSSLHSVCKDIDCIVYLAGVLFQPRPETFLHRTNTVFVQNIVDAALASGVRKFILVSFPHIEEATTPEVRATGRLDVEPKSIHARTRLEAEKYLFRACKNKIMQPLVLRAGVVYGRGVKLTEAARWLMRKRILAVWRKPTWVHLLALPDLLMLIEHSITRDNLSGIYNLCDDRPLLIQEFLDRLAAHWGYQKPWRLPAFAFYWAASLCETGAIFLHTGTPLTRDIVDMAMTSVVADTARMKQELMPQLAYPTLDQGLTIV